MINLCTGALPRRTAAGVFQVIQYLREMGGYDDQFADLPDEISIPAVRVAMRDLSLVSEFYSAPGRPVVLKILDRNPRSPKVMLLCGQEERGLIEGESRMFFTANPFREIKRIEEYEGQLNEDPNVKYKLIKARLEKMDVTFLKWTGD